MQLSEYCQYDGTGLAELVRQKEVTIDELSDCALRAVAKVNPVLNAVMDTLAEDQWKTDFEDAVFAGVPFLIKDIVIQMQGVKAEVCSSLLEGVVAEHDSDLMTRYREAGLVTIGRTPTPEFGYCATTESRFNGPTRNPWDISRMPGGSSGGSAAAVAAGIVPMAHANDGGGSIRIPASCCGLVGLKPSRGRTPVGPNMSECLSGLAIEHALTRSVRDSAALLDASEGPGVGDLFEIGRPQNSYQSEVSTAPGKLNIAWSDYPWSSTQVDEDVKSALANTVALLEELGHHLDNRHPEFDEEAFWLATGDIWSANLASMITGASAMLGREISSTYLETSTIACYEYGKTLSAIDLITAQGVMNTVTRSVAPFFTQYDILVTPTVTVVPPALGTLDANKAGWTAQSWTEATFNYCPFTPLFNTTGQPAISLPLGQSPEGLPIGIQFVAAYGRENLLYRLAGQLEAAAPWSDRRPVVFAGS